MLLNKSCFRYLRFSTAQYLAESLLTLPLPAPPPQVVGHQEDQDSGDGRHSHSHSQHQVVLLLLLPPLHPLLLPPALRG